MTTEASQAFGQMLARARLEKKLSVRGAAKKADLSEGLWRQLEKGYRQVAAGVQVPTNPRPTTVRAAAQAVGLDLAEALETAGHTREAQDAAQLPDLLVLADLDPDTPISPAEIRELQRLERENNRMLREVLDRLPPVEGDPT